MSFAEEVGSRFVAWLASLPAGRLTRIHIVCDSDADGLPAGALLVRTLKAAGFADVTAEARRKGESAWGADLLERVRAHKPDALIVADLGSRDGVLLPGLPTLLLDHHWPTGIPEGALLLTAYGTGAEGGDGKDVATTGLMAWWCARSLVGEQHAEQWLWLAAISLLSDLGDKAPFPELARAKKQFGGGVLRDSTSLLNAPRRTAAGNADAALRLLLKAEGPRQILSGEFDETSDLLGAKSEVGTALALARKLPPRFSTRVRDELGADLVAIRIDTPCQVHPLVAMQWRSRFPKSVVFGVNVGYKPGWVHFSGRAPAGVNLLEFLRRHRPHEADMSYGLGHNQASGGALTVPVWNRWAAEVGFGPELQVLDPDAQENGGSASASEEQRSREA